MADFLLGMPDSANRLLAPAPLSQDDLKLTRSLT
jgi:hypothetical protein